MALLGFSAGGVQVVVGNLGEAMDLLSSRIDRQRPVCGLAAHEHRISERKADL